MTWVLNRFRTSRRDPMTGSLVQHFDYQVTAAGELVLRPQVEVLTPGLLADGLRGLEPFAIRCFTSVTIDFRACRSFDGPWGTHFAVVIRLARRSGIPVRMTGLAAQPAAIAWMFRDNRELRALLGSTPAAA